MEKNTHRNHPQRSLLDRRAGRPALPAVLVPVSLSLAAIVFVFVSSVSAQEASWTSLDPRRLLTQYALDVWQTEQGLPQNSVAVLLQSSDGYLWAGTQEGLVRFDGVSFTVFDKKNTPGFVSNDVRALLERPDGSLWIGTSDGLLQLKDGIFETILSDAPSSRLFVYALEEDRSGRLWIGLLGEGLRCLIGDSLLSYDVNDGLPDNFVWAIEEMDDGSVVVGTSQGIVREADGKFAPLPGAESLSREIVWSLLKDRNGSLWIGTGRGLFTLTAGVLKHFTRYDGMGSEAVRVILRDRRGVLWVGTDGGLYRFHNGVFSRLTAGQGLSTDFILSLYEDREGSLWIGTYGGGMNRLKNGKFLTITTREGLSSDFARAVYESRDGAVWVATQGAGVNRIRDGRIEHFTTKDGLSDNVALSICEDRNGAIWFGTNSGLDRFDGRSFRSFTTKDGLADNNVRALLVDRSGTLWIGTRGGGLSSFRDGRFTNYRNRGFPSDVIRYIHEDSAGAIWFGTSDGLVRLKDGNFTTYSTTHGLSNNFVYAIHEDDEGTLWIGTYGGGLNRFKDGEFTRITTKEGLFDDVVFRILEDSRRGLWITCNKGVFRLSIDELNEFAEGRRTHISFRAFGAADGMKSSECNGSTQPAGWRTRDGRLWIPTIKGVAIIDPEDLGENTIPPPVVVEKVIFDRSVASPGELSALPPGRRELEIHYSALSFLAPEKVQFRYKLEGFDTDWIDVGSRRTAYYTNLPPGRYVFRVIACNNDGVWNTTGASLNLNLRPHFYEAWGFHVFLLVAFIAAVFAAYRMRLQHLKDREAELSKRIEEAIAHIKVLSGLLPICSSCKKIRDDSGYWNQLEVYIQQHSHAEFSHAICPDCFARLYPDYSDILKKRQAGSPPPTLPSDDSSAG